MRRTDTHTYLQECSALQINPIKHDQVKCYKHVSRLQHTFTISPEWVFRTSRRRKLTPNKMAAKMDRDAFLKKALCVIPSEAQCIEGQTRRCP